MKGLDLARLSLAQAADFIQRRKISPLELTKACLDRIEALDRGLNAFITVTAEEALRAAGQADREISLGEYKGPLHGIPVALKDIIHVAGVRTTAGSQIMADFVPREDAEVTRRLRAAGAVILGKLNLHEFAFGATGINPHYGATRNPWDRSRIAGGSSSGAAASVAAGLCLVAIGTDTGGSIRIPAALCGVVGLKPTYGRVSRRGIVPLSWSLDHVGPLTRTAEDAAIVLRALAGRDPADPSSSHEAVPDYRRQLRRRGGLKGLRVGAPRKFFYEGVDQEVLAVVERALGLLEDQGAVVVEVSLPYVGEVPAAVSAIMLPEALAYHQRWLAQRPQDYGEDVRQRLEMGLAFPAVYYIQAQRLRELVVRRWEGEVFSKVDLLATPTTALPAPPVESSDLRTTMALVRLTNPFNLAGLPAISVPCGLTRGGLPLGLQLVAPWWREELLLQAAHAYEKAAGARDGITWRERPMNGVGQVG